jgi:hypothetical protein
MKKATPVVLALMSALVLCASDVWAQGRGHGKGRSHSHQHHHRGSQLHFNLMLGGMFWRAPPPYYAVPYSRPVIVQAAPPVHYIEQGLDAERSGEYWYFCGEANAYYPYVAECPGGWQQVAPSAVLPPTQ